MGVLEETRFIERLQFFNGQRLFASDLQGVETFNREMRWLHNKSLHQPGIGSGFAVYGKKGDREIKIKPGYAIDSMGREIVLTEAWVEPVPPVACEDDGKSVFFDLTVSYPDDTELEEVETREGICLPRGVVRLREQPVFCWVRLQRDDQGNLRVMDPNMKNDIKDGLKIILARAEVLDCQLDKDLSIAERRSARPTKQPYLACGVVEPTKWEPLELSAMAEGQVGGRGFFLPCGLTAEIDTADAGFLTTPCYSAQIAGSRILIGVEGTTHTSTLLLDGLLSIRDPRSTGFKVDVLLIAQNLTSGSVLEGGQMTSALASEEQLDCDQFLEPAWEFFSKWHIIWMGIEG